MHHKQCGESICPINKRLGKGYKGKTTKLTSLRYNFFCPTLFPPYSSLANTSLIKSPIYLCEFRVSTFKWRRGFYVNSRLVTFFNCYCSFQFHTNMMSGAVWERIKVRYQSNMFTLICLLNIFNFQIFT